MRLIASTFWESVRFMQFLKSSQWDVGQLPLQDICSLKASWSLEPICHLIWQRQHQSCFPSAMFNNNVMEFLNLSNCPREWILLQVLLSGCWEASQMHRQFSAPVKYYSTLSAHFRSWCCHTCHQPHHVSWSQLFMGLIHSIKRLWDAFQCVI